MGDLHKFVWDWYFQNAWSYNPDPVLVTRGIFWPQLFTGSPHASPKYEVLKTQMYTLSLLFQILMYQAFSLVDFLALMELGDLHSTERKFFSNFLLIWYFLILEVGETFLDFVKFWLYHAFSWMDFLAMPGDGWFAQICVGLIFEKYFLYNPDAVLVPRGILASTIHWVSHASPDYGVFNPRGW